MSIITRWRTADLERLPEIPGVNYEIIDGELYVSTSPDLDHQDICLTIAAALRELSGRTRSGRAFIAPGLVFEDDDNLVPDVVWISHERLAVARDDKGHLRVAPELLVEVLSPGRANEMRDREAKLSAYARHGALEYWIVDRWRREVEVYRREGDELRLAVTARERDALSSPLLPGFSLPVAELFANLG